MTTKEENLEFLNNAINTLNQKTVDKLRKNGKTDIDKKSEMIAKQKYILSITFLT